MKHLMAAMAMAGLCLASFVAHGAVINPTTACNAALDDTPDAVMLKSKMVLDSKIRPDLKMLADERRPTKRDKEAIATVFAEDQRCRDLGQEFRATFYPPAIVAASDANWNEIKALTAKLYSGKLVYGQFNEQRMAIADAAHLRQANIVQDLRSEKAAREARERSAAQQDAMVQAQR